MSNKIEAGCLALVIGSDYPENNGRVVRVLEFLGDVTIKVPPYTAKSKGNREWLLDTSITRGIKGVKGEGITFQTPNAPEVRLLRIDGYDPQNQLTAQHTPNLEAS